jgi:hypothetical protein
MNCYRLPIFYNGKIGTSSLKEIKGNVTIDVIDVMIVHPEFDLDEKVTFDGKVICSFKGNYSKRHIVGTINKDLPGDNQIKIQDDTVKIYFSRGAHKLEFDSEGRIASILGITSEWDYEALRWITISSKLKLKKHIAYYDVKYNSQPVAIITENRVLNHEAFVVKDMQEISLSITNDKGKQIECYSGQLVCKVSSVSDIS